MTDDDIETTDSAANMESNNTNAPNAALQDGQYHQRVRIHVHSVRKRLADPDGISAKAAIDGIVEAGVLKDDSPEEIKEVLFSQEKTKGEEYTEVTIDMVGDIYNKVIWNLSRDEFEHCDDVAQRCGCHVSTIRKALAHLYQGDLVERKTEGRKHLYRNRQKVLDFGLDQG